MRFWVGVGSALGLGGILGFAAAYSVLEERLYKKYEESLDEMQHVYEDFMKNSVTVNVFHETPDQVTEYADGVPLQTNDIMTIKDGDIKAGFEPAEKDPYWVAPEIPVIAADVNHELSYIEPEDYEEEDGRAKLQIEVMMDGPEAIFMMDGEQMYDWDEHVGPQIAQDLINLTPPGQQQVLYVRNHKTDCDYEVMRVSP